MSFPRVSPIFLYWAAITVLLGNLATLLVWPNKYSAVGAGLVAIYILFGPSCPHCFHAVFWDRNPKDPDHWRFYRPRFGLHPRCRRCGRDLIGH
jgi:hypothetical protein